MLPLATTRNACRAAQVRRYGRTDAVQITALVCLWYGSFRSRTVRVILVRDDKPRTRGRDDRGYELPLVTTDLESSAEDLVARHAARWGIEQAFADASNHGCGPGPQWDTSCRGADGAFRADLLQHGGRLVRALHGEVSPDDVVSRRARPAGTPRRPNRPTTTWPSSSAVSSSPPDFVAHVLSRPPARTRAVLAALGGSWHIINKNCETQGPTARKNAETAGHAGSPRAALAISTPYRSR
jgi:hypothetical protein